MVKLFSGWVLLPHPGFFGLTGFNAAILYMISFITGFGSKLKRKH
jgi:hypothetical protein